MNTFEQLIGRRINEVLRLDTGEDFPSLPYPLGIYMMLDEESGLFVSFHFHAETIEVQYLSVEELKDYYGTESGESCLKPIEQPDKLNTLIGQNIKSIRIAQFENDKLIGPDFVVKNQAYAGLILKTTNDSIVMYSTKMGGKVIFDSDEFPVNGNNWTLQ